MPPFAFFRGQIVPLEEAKLGIMTHALHYGTACFEGIRGNWNVEDEQLYLFRPDAHYERLLRSCRILKIKLPYSAQDLCDITRQVVERCGFREDVYVRPLAYKSSEVIGVRLHDLEDDFLLFVAPFGNYLDVEKGISCCISTWRRIDDTSIPARAKITGLYVNSALAKTEAQENGFDEGIMLGQDGHISEGSGENFFLVMNGQLVTPPVSDNILVGITRQTVMQMAKDELGIATVERSIDRSEPYVADECFLTGTAAHLSPVVSLDRRPIGNGQIGPVTSRLQALYFDVVRGKVDKYRSWCVPAFPKPVPSP